MLRLLILYISKVTISALAVLGNKILLREEVPSCCLYLPPTVKEPCSSMVIGEAAAKPALRERMIPAIRTLFVKFLRKFIFYRSSYNKTIDLRVG